MQIERCDQPFSLLLTPSIKLQAEALAQRRGLSIGALIRTLLTREHLQEFGGSSTFDFAGVPEGQGTSSYSHCPKCGDRLHRGSCDSCGWPS